MSIDLHIHSTASDGLLTPVEVVNSAKNLGLKTIAITDHDTVSGVDAALQEGSRIGVRVIPALEINAEDQGHKVHILGYFVDHHNENMVARLEQLRVERETRIYHTIQRLAGIGVRINPDILVALSTKGTIGRSTLARQMIEAGYVRDKKEAYDRFIGEGAPAFVPRPKLTPEEAIELVLVSGGIPFWAHPGANASRAQAVRYKSTGLRGLEVYHHSHDYTTTRYLQGLAADLDLLVSGGSDCHGRLVDGRLRMGCCKVPDKIIRDIALISKNYCIAL